MKPKKPSPVYIEDPQNFRQTLLLVLNKLGGHDTQKTATEELRELFATQVLDSERLTTVLRLIAETNEHQKSATKKELVRAIIVLAEVFEEKLVEYFPKIIAIIARRLKEDDPQVNVASAETTKALISTCLKGLSAEQFTEQVDMMLKAYLALFPKTGKFTQKGAAMCIAKIIQTSPIECVFELSDEILQRLTEIIKWPTCKAHLQILEALLSLISATEDNPDKLGQIFEAVFPVVMSNFEHADWNVRKICVEIMYAFNIFTPGLVMSNKEVIVEVLDKLRADKSKQVRDITLTTLHAIDGKRRSNKSSPSKLDNEDSFQKRNIHDETFGGGDKQSQRNRSPGGRLKVNESFFENAPKDGEIQIKFKSPPKGYHYEGEEEEKGSRASPSKNAVRTLNFGSGKPEIRDVIQKMSQINNNQSKIIDSIENFQSNSKQELSELKSRVNFLEDKLQKIYKESPTNNPVAYQQQGIPLNLSAPPLFNPNASIQVIPQGETIIYGQPPGISNITDVKPYAKQADYEQYNSKAQDFQESPKRFSPKKTCWERINEFLSAGSLNDAYETCLLEGDETVLINLMEETGVVTDQLDIPIVESLLWRVRDLLQNPEYIPILLEWIQGALELELPGPLVELLNEDLQGIFEENAGGLDSRGRNILEKCFSAIKRKQAVNVSLY